jgi:tRNA A-37 threonylcarbamoyl transferase component Bud32
LKETSHNTDDSLPLEELQRVVDLCDSFEADWQTGTRPNLEATVAKGTPLQRGELLLRLVELELELRAKSGEQPNPEEYRVRFPYDHSTIDQAFGNLKAIGHQAVSDHQIEGYQILTQIGQGGMGVVYQAIQLAVGRVVAIKMIRKELLEHVTPSARELLINRFLTESRATAVLTHDNIVRVYDAANTRDGLYFTMQFIEGRTLSRLIQSGKMTNRRAAQLLAPIVRAIQYAHEQGILHRDLKPSNILVAKEGRPYVTDFGLAKLVENGNELTPSGAIIGTHAYLAPEIVQNQGKDAYSPASDIYSLGVVLYQMLTRRTPFVSTITVQLYRQIIEEEPVAPSAISPGIDRSIETICLKCLRKDTQSRYRSAAELADDLERYLADQPILAQPMRWWQQAWRWRKQKSVQIFGLVVGLLLSVGLVAIGMGARPKGWDEWRYQRATAVKTSVVTAGESVELIDTTQAIPPHRWRFGRGDVNWSTTVTGEKELTVTAQEPSLFELLPRPGSSEYEVTVILRHEQVYHQFALVGLFVGHTPFQTSEGAQHAVVCTTFADIGPMALDVHRGNAGRFSKVQLHTMVLGHSIANPARSLRSSDTKLHEIQYRAPAPHNPPGPDRKVSVIVRDRTVTVICDWENERILGPFQPIVASGKLLDPKKLIMYPDLDVAPTLWNANGGIGLYLHGCKLTVSSFQVRPLTSN